MRLRDLSGLLRHPGLASDLVAYWRSARTAGTRMPTLRRLRFLAEATADTPFDSHYVYHTAWATRILQANPPPVHIDVSSSLYFVALASAIVPIEHYDYRPPDLVLPNVKLGHADLVALPFADHAIASLSCMHVVEHIGLGRYGDPVDALGDAKARAELSRVLAPGGQLLFVVPVGRPAVIFNAHRIYAFDDVVAGFPDLVLEHFSLITDSRDGRQLIFDADPARVAKQKFGCGCFVFRRPVSLNGQKAPT